MPGREVYVRDQLVLQPALGLVNFVHQRRVLLAQATAGVVYRSAHGRRKRLDLAGHQVSYGLARDTVSLSVANDELELTWHLALGEEMRLHLEVRNVGSEPVRIEELCVLDVAARHGGSVGFSSPLEEWRFYQNGWQSWTPTFARRITDGIWLNPNTQDYRIKHQPHALFPSQNDLSSEWFTVIVSSAEDDSARSTLSGHVIGASSSDPALLLGFISAADQLAEIRLEVRNTFRSLRAITYADGFLLSPAAKLSSEILLFAVGNAPLALMDMYAVRLGETMHARVSTDIPTGWSTRYCFSGREDGDNVLENLAQIKDKKLPLDVVLIDDGYQIDIGDWLEIDDTRYQNLKGVVQQIAGAGYHPGIWIAPFAVSASSKLYANHPDWVLRNDRGDAVLVCQRGGIDVYALDLSLSAVQTWLQDVFHVLSDDWGFEFFKLDLVFAAALPGVRSDPCMTRARAVRRGLEIVRAAIGDRFLLACGAPFGPSVGIVDAMRSGPDMHVEWHPFWQSLGAPAAANAALNAITRSFIHRKLWLSDLDCLVLRSRGNGSNLVLNEVRTLVTIVGLTGALVVDSDNLTSMQRGRLRYLQKILPPCGCSAIPLDLFQHERPRLLVLPLKTTWGSWTIVALLNWDDRSCVTRLKLSQLGLPPGSYHVYNYWRQRYLGLVHDEVVINPHQPHETVLLLIRPKSDQPQLLSSTFHLLQGMVEVRDVRFLGDKLIVEMEKPGKQFGHLLFAVPAGHSVLKALINGRAQRPRQIAKGIWRLGFSLKGKATVELLFG